MIKTVSDAVNQFNSEWPKTLSCVKDWTYTENRRVLNYKGVFVCNKVDFELAAEFNKYGRACFDLMFYGCQSINAPQALELIKAIKEGKINGVTFTKDN